MPKPITRFYKVKFVSIKAHTWDVAFVDAQSSADAKQKFLARFPGSAISSIVLMLNHRSK